MNPFNFTGPEFIQTYLLVFAVAVLAAVALRWMMRQPGGQPAADLDNVLSPYEIAYLAGGELAAIDAAIVRLLRHDGLPIASNASQLERGDRALPKDAHPLEQMIAGAVKNGAAEIDQIRAAGSPAVEKLRTRLVEMGLLVSREHANLIGMLSAGVMLAVMFFGLTKFFMGVARDKPVGYLVLLLIVTAVTTAAFFLVRPFRSRRGDVALRYLLQDNAALKDVALRHVTELTEADLIIALGLFGTGILAGSSFAHMLVVLHKVKTPAPVGPSGSGTWWSSCGSSSSCGSGGSSCGGGGSSCGGGGCGGCGGGGD